MRKMMAVMSFVFVLVLMVGCAKPPQDTINAANSALDAKGKLTPDVIEKIETIMGNKPAAPQRY